MNPDGSDPRQLTSLSQPFSSQYLGFPSLVGGVAFDRTNPKRFAVGIGVDTAGDYRSAIVTLK